MKNTVNSPVNPSAGTDAVRGSGEKTFDQWWKTEGDSFRWTGIAKDLAQVAFYAGRISAGSLSSPSAIQLGTPGRELLEALDSLAKAATIVTLYDIDGAGRDIWLNTAIANARVVLAKSAAIEASTESPQGQK